MVEWCPDRSLSRWLRYGWCTGRFNEAGRPTYMEHFACLWNQLDHISTSTSVNLLEAFNDSSGRYLSIALHTHYPAGEVGWGWMVHATVGGGVKHRASCPTQGDQYVQLYQDRSES